VVQGGPLRGASSGAARGWASRGIKPQLARTVRPGIPRRSHRVLGAARLSGALSEQWTRDAILMNLFGFALSGVYLLGKWYEKQGDA